MNFDKTNSILTLIANIGVLVGLILLILELRQTQDAMSAQTSLERTSRVFDITSDIFDRNMISIGRKYQSGIELTEEEINEANRYAVLAMRHHEDLFYQRQLGLIDDELWQALLVSQVQLANGVAFEIAWPNWPDSNEVVEPQSFRASYVSHISSLIE
jgi:hypothetical protein